MKGPIGVAGLAAVLLLALPPGAAGDGLPVGDVDAGRARRRTARQPDRYVTLPAGRDTVVARVRRAGGRVRGSRLLRGAYTVPAVALDASASGLSGDGRTLALIRPRRRFPRAHDARRARHGAPAAAAGGLPAGDFSFDALSPDGRPLYLIHYLSRRDPTRYEVRAYDVPGGRLAARADRRSAGGGRAHARAADHARRERGRALALHALRRRGVAPVHPRARHGRPDRGRASTSTASPVARTSTTCGWRLRGRRGAGRARGGRAAGAGRPRDVPRAAARATARAGAVPEPADPTWPLLALACLPAVAAGAALAFVRRRRRGPGETAPDGASASDRRTSSRPATCPDRGTAPDGAIAPVRGTSVDVSLV